MILLSVDGALKDGAVSGARPVVLLDRHLGGPAQIQCALFGASGWSGTPFDGAVDGAAHLLEPPGCPGTEHLAAAISGPRARHHSVKGQVELRPVAALGFEVKGFVRRFRRSVDDVFHMSFLFTAQ